jgi:hypothetical protein
MRELIERLEEASATYNNPYVAESQIREFWERLSRAIHRYHNKPNARGWSKHPLGGYGGVDAQMEAILGIKKWGLTTPDAVSLLAELRTVLRKGGGRSGWKKIVNKWLELADPQNTPEKPSPEILAAQVVLEKEALKKFINPMKAWAKKHKKQYGKFHTWPGA